MTELYNEGGEKAGLYDVCAWWIEKYPEDVYTGESGEKGVLYIVKIREYMMKILGMRKKMREVIGNG